MYCSISTWDLGRPFSRARRKIGREPRRDAFDRFRGMNSARNGPSSSTGLTREIHAGDRAVVIVTVDDVGSSTRGSDRCVPGRAQQSVRQVCWYTSASSSLITASPSKSAVNASVRRRRPMTVFERRLPPEWPPA